MTLGGNSLGNTPEEQLTRIKETVKPIAAFYQQGYQVIISHGNGPQVGMIHLGMSSVDQAGTNKPNIPFPECVAMSQGYIGFHLQRAIENELILTGIRTPVATIVTQVLVNAHDEAFEKPTKPIGAFYSREQAIEIMREKGFMMVEDAGRGYRRVVPSPKPIDIVEKDVIKAFVDLGAIAIACGGGGIPVICRNGKLEGVDAVIDKDAASAKLAEVVGADVLIFLTGVDRVALNYGKPNMLEIEKMTVDEALEYCRQGHFAPGSMLPKVEAAIAFAKTGGTAIIASLQNATTALAGLSGTVIMERRNVNIENIYCQLCTGAHCAPADG